MRERAKWRFALGKEQITPIALLSSKVTGANCSRLLFFQERLEQFAHSHSFVKSDENKSLLSLLTKEQRSKELREQLALGHKKGKTVKNICKNMNLFELISRF